MRLPQPQACFKLEDNNKRQTGRQTDKQRDRQTHRQTDGALSPSCPALSNSAASHKDHQLINLHRHKHELCSQRLRLSITYTTTRPHPSFTHTHRRKLSWDSTHSRIYVSDYRGIVYCYCAVSCNPSHMQIVFARVCLHCSAPMEVLVTVCCRLAGHDRTSVPCKSCRGPIETEMHRV